MGMASGAGGLGGYGVSDSPYGAAAGAALPFILPPAARNVALSSLYQRLLASPSYGLGASNNALQSVVLNPAFSSALTGAGATGLSGLQR